MVNLLLCLQFANESGFQESFSRQLITSIISSSLLEDSAISGIVKDLGNTDLSGKTSPPPKPGEDFPFLFESSVSPTLTFLVKVIINGSSDLNCKKTAPRATDLKSAITRDRYYGSKYESLGTLDNRFFMLLKAFSSA